MASSRDLEQLVLGHQLAVRLIRERIEAYAKALWSTLPAYRDENIDQLVAAIAPAVLAGQIQVANLTDEYLSRLAGATARPADQDLVTGGAVRAGTVPDEVYRRPAVTTYTALSEGKPFDQAVGLGAGRLASIVVTDLMLARRQQEQLTMERVGFETWRRVLTGRENCAMCAIASTQRYRTGELRPIHPGCDCDVAPGEAGDVGQVINERLLEQLHDSIHEQIGERDRSARDLGIDKRDSQGRPISDFTELIVVQHHGEYGPTLAWRGDRFTGPGDLAA